MPKKSLFNEYSKFMDLLTKKPLHKWEKIVLFPIWCLFVLFLVLSITAVRRHKIENPHRYSNKYRKVIKEGVFFTTTEYHEKD